MAESDWKTFERQFAGDRRFIFKHFNSTWNGADSYFTQVCASENVRHVIDWPRARAVQLGDGAATTSVASCSVGILSGDEASSHWIFSHVQAGNGFPESDSLKEAVMGISGEAQLYIIGACPFAKKYTEEFRRIQVKTLYEQVQDYHINLQKHHVRTYWNSVPQSYIDVVARVGEQGVERVHVIHVAE